MSRTAVSFSRLPVLVALLALGASVALASPPAATDDPPRNTAALGGVDVKAEYRVQSIYLNPLELSGNEAETMNYTEQRFRLEPSFKLGSIGRIVSQFDLLGGVLFGDNGDYGRDPSPAFGLGVTSRWPNNSAWTVGLRPGTDPLHPDSYGPQLIGVDPIRVNHAYGEVLLPFGILRVGRQPSATGPGINLHDGSRSNRWGVSRYSTTADRFLFATKISEAFRMLIDGKDYKVDRSMDNGVFIGAGYDLVVEDDLYVGGDDLHQAVGVLQWKAKQPEWLGRDWRDLLLQLVVGTRFGDEFGTSVYAIPVTMQLGYGQEHDFFKVDFRGEFVSLFGHTREISEGLAALRESDATRRVIRDQDMEMFGAQALLDLTFGPVMATLEFDYASGDEDPRDTTPMTTYNFSRDANVGLLLFEHILAYETARSAAVGIENLKNMGTASFPLTELASQGRVHNAMIFFPQVLYKPVDPFGVRFGAMFAWSASPVVDPVMSLLNEDGESIADDVVNWHGGKPGSYYGTELDLQLEWTYKEHFIWTLEGALLLPGDALQDESGAAVTSFLFENRFTFVF